MRLAVCLSLALALGCDVESSLGEHDASLDAPALDAATTDGGDGSVDAGLDAEPDDASSDAAPSCAAPDGGACVACQASACCEAFAACALAAPCPCIVDCLLQGHALDGVAVDPGSPVLAPRRADGPESYKHQRDPPSRTHQIPIFAGAVTSTSPALA